MKKIINSVLNYFRKEWYLFAMVLTITVIIMLFEIF